VGGGGRGPLQEFSLDRIEAHADPRDGPVHEGAGRLLRGRGPLVAQFLGRPGDPLAEVHRAGRPARVQGPLGLGQVGPDAAVQGLGQRLDHSGPGRLQRRVGLDPGQQRPQGPDRFRGRGRGVQPGPHLAEPEPVAQGPRLVPLPGAEPRGQVQGRCGLGQRLVEPAGVGRRLGGLAVRGDLLHPGGVPPGAGHLDRRHDHEHRHDQADPGDPSPGGLARGAPPRCGPGQERHLHQRAAAPAAHAAPRHGGAGRHLGPAVRAGESDDHPPRSPAVRSHRSGPSAPGPSSILPPRTVEAGECSGTLPIFPGAQASAVHWLMSQVSTSASIGEMSRWAHG
jgi:hypothetical protein